MEISRKRVLDELDKIPSPTDIEDLIKKGVLIPKGKRYQISDISQLPEDMRAMISELEIDPKGGFLIRFVKPSKEVQRLLNKTRQTDGD